MSMNVIGQYAYPVNWDILLQNERALEEFLCMLHNQYLEYFLQKKYEIAHAFQDTIRQIEAAHKSKVAESHIVVE